LDVRDAVSAPPGADRAAKAPRTSGTGPSGFDDLVVASEAESAAWARRNRTLEVVARAAVDRVAEERRLIAQHRLRVPDRPLDVAVAEFVEADEELGRFIAARLDVERKRRRKS
jgi:hypothetical protein